MMQNKIKQHYLLIQSLWIGLHLVVAYVILSGHLTPLWVAVVIWALLFILQMIWTNDVKKQEKNWNEWQETLLKQQREAQQEQEKSLQKVQKNLEIIETLNIVGQDIIVHLKLSEIIQAVHHHIRTLLPHADIFAVGLLSEDHKNIEFLALRIDSDETYKKTISIDDENSLSAYTMRHQKELLINDCLVEFHHYIPKYPFSLDEQLRRSLIYLPIVSKEKALGVITVQSYQTEAFESLHVDILRTISIFTGIAIENANIYAKINDQNQKVIDSINYAQRIQAAMMPTLTEIKDSLPHSFVLLRPRDIVSGDFYFFQHYKEAPQEVIVLAAIDCTGHGVPGAFMSMIGNEILNQIINEKNIIDPQQILTLLHEGIRNALKQEETRNRDGMDLALCIIDKKTEELHFAGAYNPLIYFKNGELISIKADKNPIGGWHMQGNERSFTKHTLKLEKGMRFYMFSDGFQDQIGKDGRRFTVKRFYELLSQIHQQPFEMQPQLLNEALAEWAQGEKQLDDILVIGFEYQMTDN